MLLNDLSLFMFLFLSEIAAFLILHIILLRLTLRRNLLYCSTAAALLAILIVSILSYPLAGIFSSTASYAVALAGSGLAALFAAGLYTFLGPATADRSLACQMLVHMHGRPGGRIGKKELARGFDPYDFVEKRIEECKAEGIVAEEDSTIVLTEKGKRVARPYLYMLRLLRLRERAGYRQYFGGDKRTP